MKLMTHIKQLLELRGENYSDLARAIGVTPQAVEQWFATGSDRKTTPRGKRLDAIADHFGMTRQQLEYPDTGPGWDAETIELATWYASLPHAPRLVFKQFSEMWKSTVLPNLNAQIDTERRAATVVALNLSEDIDDGIALREHETKSGRDRKRPKAA